MPHSEHISKVYKNGGKGWGRQNSTYHPMLMTWAIALLARISSGTDTRCGEEIEPAASADNFA